jgi:7,8-dihydro-6-hydroxymethylpterin dimethyltransferase
MEINNVLARTWSICPICLKRIPAERIKLDNETFLQKTCEKHGTFRNIIWRGYSDISKWIGDSDHISSEDGQCPNGCGLCSDHLQKTCCVLLNITNRCNLQCRFCFAENGGWGDDPSFDEIAKSLSDLIEKGKTLVQLSGGEPTVREDLPEIIKVAKETGAKYVQLNSNGIRLGNDKQYVRKLAEAGLSFVFMQFDGTNDQIFEALRGKPLLEIKRKAIDNCAAYNIGVTLVPTIVRDINIQNIGDILRFAISQSPKVRGVHFQPVTFIGRMPEYPKDNDRITLDELVFEICRQADEIIKIEDLLPSACDHPLCGFHGDFIVDQEKLIALSKGDKENNCCCSTEAAVKNREFVARRWQRSPIEQAVNVSGNVDIRDMEVFLNRIKSHGFTVTAMAFQDAGTIDFSRLRNCSFHVYDKGRFVPFCSYYLSGWTQ